MGPYGVGDNPFPPRYKLPSMQQGLAALTTSAAALKFMLRVASMAWGRTGVVRG